MWIMLTCVQRERQTGLRSDGIFSCGDVAHGVKGYLKDGQVGSQDGGRGWGQIPGMPPEIVSRQGGPDATS